MKSSNDNFIYQIPDNEFTNDMEYMPEMDKVWHIWLQDKWEHERKQWEIKMRKPGEMAVGTRPT